MYFTIDTEYAINAYDAEPKQVEGSITFASEGELIKESAAWPLARFTELWNSFAGAPPFGSLRPVKKFENRGIAIRRIWQVISQGFKVPAAFGDSEPFVPAGATATIQTEPEADMPKKTSKAKKPASVRAQAADVAPKQPKQRPTATQPENGKTSRKDTVLAMIGRKNGATLPEIMEATGWLAHSVRGFIATLHTKHGVDITSSKNDAGERVYQGAAR